MHAGETGNPDVAAKKLEEIVRRYPDTTTARRAREQVRLYRGLAQAEERYPARAARDRMILTARAIEDYSKRNRRFPEGLDRMVPGYLREIPVDFWGRPLFYRPKSDGKGYLLVSYGADGEKGGTGDATDIVIEDGSFVVSGRLGP